MIFTKLAALGAALTAGAIYISSSSGTAGPGAAAPKGVTATVARQNPPIVDPALFAQYPICDATVPGCDAFGNFNPQASIELDLGAVGGVGQPTYDPQRWVVVYHFKSVNIPSGVIVTFKNHPKNPPVVWLVEENVTISGGVYLTGQSAPNTPDSSFTGYTTAGPGGFRGGAGCFLESGISSQGMGPGRGYLCSDTYGAAGGYGTVGQANCNGSGGVIYGGFQIFPFVGGSGGAAASEATIGPFNAAPGGGGGGAILIASNLNFTVNSTGSIRANGGYGEDSNDNRYSGGGSGGAIRVIAETVSILGSGFLEARGSTSNGFDGGFGRIRLEARNSQSFTLENSTSPGHSQGNSPGPIFIANPMEVFIESIGGITVPTDPAATMSKFTPDLTLASGSNIVVVIKGVNIPAGKIAYLRPVSRNNTNNSQYSGALVDVPGQPGVTSASITVTLQNGVVGLQAHVK